MKVNEHINSFEIANNLSSFNDWLSKAEGHMTFWGKRVIKAPGYKGFFPLSELKAKVNAIGRERALSDNLTTEERIAGIEMREKLICFSRVKPTNFITKLIMKIRKFKLPRSGCRLVLKNRYWFQTYTKNSFKQEFGENKKVIDDYEIDYLDSKFVVVFKEAIYEKLGRKPQTPTPSRDLAMSPTERKVLESDMRAYVAKSLANWTPFGRF